MGLFDRLKMNKGPKKDKKGKKPEENVLNLVKEPAAKDEKEKAVKVAVVKGNTGDAYRILLAHRLSEKTNALSKAGKYVFQVHPDANKPEVRKAVEKVYDVHVRKVNMVSVLGKKRRYGRAVGRTNFWKKAIVTVAAGERIEGLIETV